jgi:hypothetical protein
MAKYAKTSAKKEQGTQNMYPVLFPSGLVMRNAQKINPFAVTY